MLIRLKMDSDKSNSEWEIIKEELEDNLIKQKEEKENDK